MIHKNTFIKLFTCNENYTINEYYENNDSLCVKLEAKDINLISAHEFELFINTFPSRDKLHVDINMDNMDAISYRKTSGTTAFIEDLQEEIESKEDESKFEFKLTVYKQIVNNIVSIYDLSKYVEYLKELSLEGVLHVFESYRVGDINDITYFELLNEENIFNTEIFHFTSRINSVVSKTKVDRIKIFESQKLISNYSNYSNYLFTPNDFYLTGSAPDDLNDIFEKLCTLLSLVFLADISNFEDKNSIYFRINGYKMIQTKINYQHMKDNNFKEVYEIYSWVYNEGNLSDKVGLARNIISLNFTESILINDSTYASILSGYEIYLKKNIEQYIEVKNKVSEFLIDLSNKSSSIVTSLANSIKNNTLLFITYFISIVIFNSLSSNKDKIFTSETEIVSYGILLISLLFLVVSYYYALLEKKRFMSQYQNLKKLYNDILDENDINRIFKEDMGYAEDLKFINSKINIFTLVWAFEILAIFVIVFLSSHPIPTELIVNTLRIIIELHKLV